jgi:hypothetical protein
MEIAERIQFPDSRGGRPRDTSGTLPSYVLAARIAGARFAAEAGQAHLALARILERLDSRLLQSNPHIDVGGEGADIAEPRHIHLVLLVSDGVRRQLPRNAAQIGAVLRRHLVEIQDSP